MIPAWESTLFDTAVAVARKFDHAVGLRTRGTAGVAAAVRDGYSRLRRGWSPRDVWSVDAALCRLLGEMLAQLAAVSHGWPKSEDYPTYESWTSALNSKSADLLAYDPDDEASYAAAQAAMHWVADHLGALWD